MEGRPERIADYFMVVGVGNESISKFEQFSSEEEVTLPDNSEVLEPITDIAVYYSKHEQLPKSYRVIETTPQGHSANLSVGSLFSSGPIYICYKKGKDKPPIVDVGVFHTNQNQSPPVGYETLVFSIGGRSADLNKGGRGQSYLSVKRGLIQTHNNAITDICVVASNKGEEPPTCYKLLRSLDLSKGLVGHTLHLCYRTSQVRPPSVAYTPELLSRYPIEDHPEFPLPHSVPLFCLPFGVSIEHWERHTPFPFPSFSTFALTNAQGQCMYGAVVVFYEPVGEHECGKEMRRDLNVPDEEPLHMNKCICLLSHWPFFSSFKAFLSALYRLSISHNIPLPLERFVGNLMLEVPFPTVVRPRIQMHIGSEAIVFSLPVQTPLPLSVSTHWSLLSSLDPDNCLTLLTLTLLEQKLVLHSSRPALLTCVGEALRSILFPFSWQCTYIPLCPLAFSSYMQAPVPFIIGIDSQFFDVFEKPGGVVVVDLDANSINMSKEVRELLAKHPLPSKPSKMLKQALNTLAPQVSGLDSGLDLAVEISHMDYEAKNDLEAVDVEIREVFLRFFASMIGHYRKCLIPLMSAPSERSRDISHLFNQKLFLKNCSSVEWPFFQMFFDTQIFNAFIEQRSFTHAENTFFVFFDECTEKVKRQPNCKLLNAEASINRRSDLPTVVSLPPDDMGLPKGKTYSYQSFPTSLDPALFMPASLAESGQHPKASYAHRPSVASSSGSPVLIKRTGAEKAKDRENVKKALKSDLMWSKCLLSQVCSLWYILLPSHLSTHWNKMGVLSQALELLEDMRSNKALPSDEVCYRILMQQCVNLGRPALAVRVYHEMMKAGIQPNAVTYGFYNKAVIEGAWPNQKRKWKVLLIVISACLFLRSLKCEKKTRLRSLPEDPLREPDFSLITRSTSLSSRKSISALDVGLDEKEGRATPLSRQGNMNQKGTVFRLTAGTSSGGDYVVCGDSSYMTHRSPDRDEGGVASSDVGLWSTNIALTGSQSPVRRRLIRSDPPNHGDSAPSLHVELTTCSQCSTCHYLLYDEQIMSGWNGDEANYKTTCPYCSSQLVASLTVTTRQTLPISQTSTLTTTTTAPNTTKTSSPPGPGSPVKPPQPPTLLEEGENFADLGGKTWPRSLSKSAKLSDQRLSEQYSSQDMAVGDTTPSAASLSNASPKSKGSPTSNDHTGSSADRVDTPGNHTPTRKVNLVAAAQANTDPIQRRNQSPTSQSTPSIITQNHHTPDPQICLKFTPVSETPLADDHTPKSIPEKPVLKKQIDTSSSTDHLAPRNSTPLSDVKDEHHSRSLSVALKRVVGGRGKDHTDFDLSSYIAKMRSLGHRRAASAPMKQVSLAPEEGERSVPVTAEGGGVVGVAPSRSRSKPGYKTETHPPFVVPYLPPMVLRKEVESLITQDGTKILEREELVRDRSIIYWNLVWYFSRLGLPTYLPLLHLWDFQRKNEHLKKHSLRMKIDLVWDARFPGVREPLYLLWLGIVPRPLPTSGPLKRRDSESQLQSLVARVQCGEWPPVITSLLRDRLKGAGQHEAKEAGQEEELVARSIYRETLFLNMTVSGHLDAERFDREYQQQIQRLPKELSTRLHPSDHTPSPRSTHCRRVFGLLQPISSCNT